MTFPDHGLHTARLHLRRASLADAPALLAYQSRNRAHLLEWEPRRDEAFFTLAATRQRLHEMEMQMQAQQALHLLFARTADTSAAIAGVCHFSNIVRGPFQACHLGFSVDAQEQGQGLMHEALSCAIEFVFGELHLHRIMANYRPENRRSAALLRKLHFEPEGKARAYLKINGSWADHILSARINEAMD
ncbi:GNAT family N-acetyltransferase [Herbaspirillum lusitanum]|uniref:GNAT family N-acetyltransferase n=1 Tax=Herbaspirillum lusitanum TaxID=213312 RepID=A0ABW9AA07_9BURK